MVGIAEKPPHQLTPSVESTTTGFPIMAGLRAAFSPEKNMAAAGSVQVIQSRKDKHVSKEENRLRRSMCAPPPALQLLAKITRHGRFKSKDAARAIGQKLIKKGKHQQRPRRTDLKLEPPHDSI
jgi:hypothetical protein